MRYHLLCIHPFHGYLKGQIVTDQEEVSRLLLERDAHFAKYPAPAEPEPETEAAPSVMAPPSY